MKFILILIISLGFLTSCSKGKTETIPVASSSGKVILALGDSLTIGYGLPESDSYPSQLEKMLRGLGYNYRLQNAGVSGDTTAGLLARLDWVLDGANPPDKGGWGGFVLAILCIGANDAFQGKSVTDIEKNLRSIIEKIQSKKVPILLAGMRAPFNLGMEYRNQYDALFEKLAKEYHLAFMPFFLEGVALKADLNQEDRIHPTASGYAVVVGNLVEILEDEELIEK